MRLFDVVRQAVRIHRKTVVHAGNLDESLAVTPARAYTLDRVVCAAVPLMHLYRLRARRQRQAGAEMGFLDEQRFDVSSRRARPTSPARSLFG